MDELVLTGMRIRELRKNKKLNQTELGNLIGVTKVSISGYENGTRTPSLQTLSMLCDVLETSVDYLLGREIITKQNEYISSNDVKMISRIKENPKLYKVLSKDNERMTRLIIKKIGKYI